MRLNRIGLAVAAAVVTMIAAASVITFTGGSDTSPVNLADPPADTPDLVVPSPTPTPSDEATDTEQDTVDSNLSGSTASHAQEPTAPPAPRTTSPRPTSPPRPATQAPTSPAPTSPKPPASPRPTSSPSPDEQTTVVGDLLDALLG